MRIECPACHLTGTVNELEIPSGGRDISCPRCKHVTEVPEALLHDSGLDPDVYHDQVFYESEGCDDCAGTGFLGRTAVAEL